MMLNLSPAEWIWYPSQRTIPNTFVLFRRTVVAYGRPVAASGYLHVESRYRLWVNGVRIQSGPAVSDPRWPEADPVDLASYLTPGENVIAVEALYFGHGEGTWVPTKPGFIFKLDLCDERGTQSIVSDPSWQARIDWAHRPGQHKRWFLRALQEQFDARQEAHGWKSPGYQPDASWKFAASIGGHPDKPALCCNYADYLNDATCRDASHAELRARSIPLSDETLIPVHRLRHAESVRWLQPRDDWFLFRSPESFSIKAAPPPHVTPEGVYEITLDGDPASAMALTFELQEEVVGWPYFSIDAPDGAVVELMVLEAHDPAGTLWLDNQYFAWTRFICREGVNRFETFDYESLRWMQLHISGPAGRVRIRDVGVRRKIYHWKHRPDIRCADSLLQRIFDAAINTNLNSAIEHVVDGVARERQQYLGDGGHQCHAIRLAFGQTDIIDRLLITYSQGIGNEGYFSHAYPASDMLFTRLGQRQLGMTPWGPILDHSVSVAFECWNHYFYTGSLDFLGEIYPRLIKFAQYLWSLVREHGLLPVDDLGTATVWMDNADISKQCSFNLYASAMYTHALAPLADAMGDPATAAQSRGRGSALLSATVARFWDARRHVFIDNLPWMDRPGKARLFDRTLANAILFDQCPGGNVAEAVRCLADRVPEMCLSYPANAGWRYWALAKHGRADITIAELRTIWATMQSVLLNNTIGEGWESAPDSGAQWSHCAVAPLYCLYMDIVGIKPLAPGFAEYEVRPQLFDFGDLELTAHLATGPLHFKAVRSEGGYELSMDVPIGNGSILHPDGRREPLKAGTTNHFRIMVPG